MPFPTVRSRGRASFNKKFYQEVEAVYKNHLKDAEKQYDKEVQGIITNILLFFFV